jgi:replicative DNA helicase
METTASRVTPLREPDLDRVPQPPANIEAEQALLGAILVNNTAYSRVAEFLAAEHFGNAVHGRIFAAIGKLLERGQIANPVTLKGLFDQDGALAEVGGAQYLARLAEAAARSMISTSGAS